MRIHKNFSLKKYNTFGIEARCAAFAEVKSVEDMRRVVATNKLPIQLLGGGSNILFLHDTYDVLFIKNGIQGINIVEDTEGGAVLVEIGGGVVWHDFVMWAIDNNLAGVENLALIPGTVGAAPIQNIGAYGVELKDVFERLEAFNMQKTVGLRYFSKEECQFGYRDSVFKNELKGQFFITRVFLTLQRKPTQLHIDYGDISKILSAQGIENPTIRDIANAVIAIRKSKLPDPSVIGNAGSFFKNPTIPKEEFEALKIQFPNIVGYPTENTVDEGNPDTSGKGVKVAAGWLIEQCNWKGKRLGRVGVHERQALVLVNYGGGKGSQIEHLAKKIQNSVFEKFGIRLTPEVNFL
jgi:UDP-N-acetylmuramate dehydrogenase